MPATPAPAAAWRSDRERPYTGPYVSLTLEEARLVRELVASGDGPVVAAILWKCDAALGSDPRLRTPHP